MKRDRQLQIMVRRAKSILTRASTGIRWEDAVWRVTRWLPTRESEPGNYLRFTVSGKGVCARIPLPKPFSDFAKAAIVLLWSRSRVGRDLCFGIYALRMLLCVLERRHSRSPCDLRPDDFAEAFAAYERKQVTALAPIARYLQLIAALTDRFEITTQPLTFQNPLTGRRNGRTGTAADEQTLVSRRAADKLPRMEALAAYARCTNEPVNDDERTLLRAIDLHIALGSRIGEALTVPLDCWVEEDIRDLDGHVLQNTHSGEPQRRYGIRYYPEKGYDLAINWLSEQDVPLARRAVSQLSALCAKARSVARWLEQHPGRLWHYAPDELISLREVMQHLHYADLRQCKGALREKGLHVAVVRSSQNGDPAKSYYRAGDIERAFVGSPDRLVAIRGDGGKAVLKLSQALCVKFGGQFSFKQSFRNYRCPLLITASDVRRALGQRREESIFDRRGLLMPDAAGCAQRIRIKPHSTRHWKNALYDVGGMSDLQQSWAMGRKDVRQTRGYQHRTVQEQTQLMRRFLDLSYTERVTQLRSAIRDGQIAGPLAHAYQLLALNSPTDAEMFLQTYASGIHVTPWGICANDFTLSPCRKYLQCFDNCRHYHRTGDPQEQRLLEDLRTKMQMALRVMRENAVGEAGADRWVSVMATKLANLERALAMAPKSQPMLPVQMFPGGVECATSPQKSVI